VGEKRNKEPFVGGRKKEGGRTIGTSDYGEGGQDDLKSSMALRRGEKGGWGNKSIGLKSTFTRREKNGLGGCGGGKMQKKRQS